MRMPLGQRRMIEIVRRIVNHADPFHDLSRGEVAWHGERHNLAEPQILEAQHQYGPRRLGGVSTTPVFRGEAPAYFHARSEVRGETRHGKADEARESRDVWDLHGPEAETVPIEVSLDTRRERIALFT
jgi:hypothetical protein